MRGPRPGGGGLVAGALAAMLALASGCGGPEPLVGTGQVLVRMTEWQQPWFEQEVQRFAAAREVELVVDAYQLTDDVDEALERARGKGSLPILVKVEGRMLRPLAKAGLLRPLEDVVDAGTLASDLDEYLPEALAPARFDGRTWGVPRKLEVMVLAYRRSSLRSARSLARTEREAFDALLGAHGLEVPEGRELEASPAEWDMVDLLEAARALSRIPLGGSTAPRLAFRTGDVEGTPSDLACFVYPLGHAQGRPLEDMPGFGPFEPVTRALFAGGLVPPLEGEGLLTPQLFQLWNQGGAHLSFFQQIDAKRLIGDAALPGLVPEPGDVGFAPLPAGGPWAADPDARTAPAGGWWWCLPAGAPAPDLGYALARHLTSREVHQEEARRFGMMPVRKDLREDLEATFPDEGVRRLMQVSFDALEDSAPKPALGTEAYARWRKWATGP